MAAVRTANLLFAFLLELALLGAVGYWGFTVAGPAAIKIVLGLGGPLLVAVFWGFVLAPRARVHLPGGLHLLVTASAFTMGAVALIAAGQPSWGLALGLLYVVNRVLLYILHQ